MCLEPLRILKLNAFLPIDPCQRCDCLRSELDRLHVDCHRTPGSFEDSRCRIVRQAGMKGGRRDRQAAADGFQARFLAGPAAEKAAQSPIIRDGKQFPQLRLREMLFRERSEPVDLAQLFDVDADIDIRGNTNECKIGTMAQVEAIPDASIATTIFDSWFALHSCRELESGGVPGQTTSQNLTHGTVRRTKTASVVLEPEFVRSMVFVRT